MHGEQLLQCGPVGGAQTACNPLACRGAFRHGIGLRIGQHLQAIFEPPQEAIRRAQVARGCRFDVSGQHQRLQRCQQATQAQAGLSPTTDQLQGLRKEFDLADPTRPALDVARHLLARHFRHDQGLHRAQAVERAVVQIAAIDKGLQQLQQALARIQIARHRTRLLPGIALPVAALALEILLHRRERQGYPPGTAERPQTQVDAMAEPVGGDLIEQLRQLLAEPGEIILRRQPARAIGLAFVLVGVDQIDVRAEIQLAPAQLAEAEYHQPLPTAVTIAHHAKALCEFPLQRLQCQLQAVVG